MLKGKGITVEEDLSRAARVRRRELEKLLKNIKVCVSKYWEITYSFFRFIDKRTREEMFSDL